MTQQQPSTAPHERIRSYSRQHTTGNRPNPPLMPHAATVAEENTTTLTDESAQAMLADHDAATAGRKNLRHFDHDQSSRVHHPGQAGTGVKEADTPESQLLRASAQLMAAHAVMTQPAPTKPTNTTIAPEPGTEAAAL